MSYQDIRLLCCSLPIFFPKLVRNRPHLKHHKAPFNPSLSVPAPFLLAGFELLVGFSSTSTFHTTQNMGKMVATNSLQKKGEMMKKQKYWSLPD